MNNFGKVFNQKGAKNTLIIIATIFFVICMHIRPTRLLDNDISDAKFDTDNGLRIGFTNLDWDDSFKIEDIIAIDKDNKDKIKDPREKIGK